MIYDFETLKDDKNIQNIGYKAANKFKNQLSKEEIDSCFLLALWQACNKYDANYDPEKIAAFQTYFYKGVIFECLKVHKKNSAYKKNIKKIQNGDPEKIKSYYTDNAFLELDPQDLKLSKKEKTLLANRFWNNKTLREISEEENVTPQAIKKRIVRILKKLKESGV